MEISVRLVLTVWMLGWALGACGDGADGAHVGPGTPTSDGPDAPGDSQDASPYRPGHDFSDLDDVCGLDTGYPGDILCLQEPDPVEGFQLHMGPAHRDDPVEVESFLIEPGGESTECFYVTTPNDQLETYYERLIHMRPVSHHMFLFIIDDGLYPVDKPSGWAPCGGFGDGLKGALGGSEMPRLEFPAGGEYAPENLGVGRAVPSNTLIKMEIHALNTTDQPVMREIWTNLWYKDKAEVTQPVIDLTVLGGYSYATPPGAMEVMDINVPITTPKRVLSMYGHMHAHAVRFSVWHSRGADQTLVMEDYDWFDPLRIRFDSLTANPVADRDGLTAGGMSGVLNLEPGDSLAYQCEVHNDSDVVLGYSNEAFTGEMCGLFGEFVGHGADLTLRNDRGSATNIGWLDEE